MPPAHLRGPLINFPHRGGCTGKFAYASLADARVTARKHNVKLPPYKCKHCKQWHLTSKGLVKTGD